MAIVWPCPLDVDSYVERVHEIEFPRPRCPHVACAALTHFWHATSGTFVMIVIA